MVGRDGARPSKSAFLLPERKKEKQNGQPREDGGNDEGGAGNFRTIMELGLHMASPSDQHKEKSDINQDNADASLVVGFHRELVRISIHDLAAKFKLFTGLLIHEGLELADAAVSENYELAAAVNVAHFGKPRLSWPLMWGHWLVIKRGRCVIDSNIAGIG